MSTDEEAQQDEMLALESILDEGAFQVHEMAGGIRSGQIKVRLDLADPFYVVVDVEGELPMIEPVANGNEDDDDDEGDGELGQIPGVTTGAEERYKVEFMPQLILHFTLPTNYPSQTKPNFTLSSVWLHRAPLSLLCQKLDQLWEENKGMGILFTWSNYLQANTLNDVGIIDHYHVDWIQKPFHLSGRHSKVLKHRPSILDDSSLTLATEESKENEPHELNCHTPVVTEKAEASTSSSAGKPVKKKRKTKKKGKTLVDQRAASDPVPRKDGKDVSLIDFLLSFNDELIRETFLQSSHTCDICFTMKIGSSCVRFHCGHVFCSDCVCTCFTTHITEGNVDQVKCPGFNCKIRPNPEIVKSLVGERLYERYDEILLKRALENMSDITYCPRPKCHNPVICDPNEKCASCTVCGHTFCSVCKMVYHGVEPCKFKDADMKEVFKKFTQGSSDEKRAMIKAYGEKQLKILVENVLSEQWIQSESKQCPHCKVPIEKFEGCNKVTCFKCNTYFCWLCLKQLEQGNPYFHFNDPSSKCYNNLFQDIDFGEGNERVNEWLRDIDSDSSEDDHDYLDIDDSDLDDLDYDDFLEDDE